MNNTRQVKVTLTECKICYSITNHPTPLYCRFFLDSEQSDEPTGIINIPIYDKDNPSKINKDYYKLLDLLKINTEGMTLPILSQTNMDKIVETLPSKEFYLSIKNDTNKIVCWSDIEQLNKVEPKLLLEEINLDTYQINLRVGDILINEEGNELEVVRLCDCVSCKERGLEEPILINKQTGKEENISIFAYSRIALDYFALNGTLLNTDCLNEAKQEYEKMLEEVEVKKANIKRMEKMLKL